MYGKVIKSARDAIEGFVDSSYDGCLDTRQSLINYGLTTYSIAISWNSSL